MAFTKTFPYDTGTFVLVDLDTYDENDPKTLLYRLGSVACYQCVSESDECAVMVSAQLRQYHATVCLLLNSFGLFKF